MSHAHITAEVNDRVRVARRIEIRLGSDITVEMPFDIADRLAASVRNTVDEARRQAGQPV